METLIKNISCTKELLNYEMRFIISKNNECIPYSKIQVIILACKKVKFHLSKLATQKIKIKTFWKKLFLLIFRLFKVSNFAKHLNLIFLNS